MTKTRTAAPLADDKLPRRVHLGRLDAIRSRPDAHLIAYTLGVGIFDEVTLTRYKSREALEAFCKDGSRHHALVKVPTCQTRMVNRNTQRPA